MHSRFFLHDKSLNVAASSPSSRSFSSSDARVPSRPEMDLSRLESVSSSSEAQMPHRSKRHSSTLPQHIIDLNRQRMYQPVGGTAFHSFESSQIQEEELWEPVASTTEAMAIKKRRTSRLNVAEPSDPPWESATQAMATKKRKKAGLDEPPWEEDEWDDNIGNSWVSLAQCVEEHMQDAQKKETERYEMISRLEYSTDPMRHLYRNTGDMRVAHIMRDLDSFGVVRTATQKLFHFWFLQATLERIYGWLVCVVRVHDLTLSLWTQAPSGMAAPSRC